jgi:hypothetical protein
MYSQRKIKSVSCVIHNELPPYLERSVILSAHTDENHNIIGKHHDEAQAYIDLDFKFNERLLRLTE